MPRPPTFDRCGPVRPDKRIVAMASDRLYEAVRKLAMEQRISMGEWVRRLVVREVMRSSLPDKPMDMRHGNLRTIVHDMRRL